MLRIESIPPGNSSLVIKIDTEAHPFDTPNKLIDRVQAFTGIMTIHASPRSLAQLPLPLPMNLSLLLFPLMLGLDRDLEMEGVLREQTSSAASSDAASSNA